MHNTQHTTTHNVQASQQKSEMVQVNYIINASVMTDINTTLINIDTPECCDTRVPANICIVLDLSGSMNADARTNAKAKRTGLSILDLCKHAAKTIIDALGPSDTFSLVTFQDTAKCAIPQTNVLDRDIMKQTVMNQEAHGVTNLWAGICVGVTMFNAIQGQNNHLILLTDGIPNRSPARGEVEEFKRIVKNNEVHCIMHMCGFGYDLNSDMLMSLALIGNGSYNYIPDSSMIGTVFINLASAALLTYDSHLELQVRVDANAIELLQEVGVHCVNQKSCSLPHDRQQHLTILHPSQNNSSTIITATATINFLLYGSSHVILLPFSIIDGRGNNMHVTLVNETTKPVYDADITPHYQAAMTEEQQQLARAHVSRAHLVNSIYRGVKRAKTFGDQVHNTDFALKMSEVNDSLSENTSSLALALKQDLNGEINNSISDSNAYERWGRHFLLSLAMAHQQQRCNNFKDGVHVYKTPDFDMLSDDLENIFKRLTIEPIDSVSERHDASTFINRSGVCFDGSCMIRLLDGSTIAARDVQKGTIFMSPMHATGSKVVCVVESIAEEFSQIASHGFLTPYHPIRINEDEDWMFAKSMECDRVRVSPRSVYNFVLVSHHIIQIVSGSGGNDLQAATLGHGFTDNDVICHPFFGTQAVIDALRNFDLIAFARGRVILGEVFVRDPKSKLVIGFK